MDPTSADGALSWDRIDFEFQVRTFAVESAWNATQSTPHLQGEDGASHQQPPPVPSAKNERA